MGAGSGMVHPGISRAHDRHWNASLAQEQETSNHKYKAHVAAS